MLHEIPSIIYTILCFSLVTWWLLLTSYKKWKRSLIHKLCMFCKFYFQPFSEDVTLPQLRFVNKERYSNSTVYISWNYNEPAKSNCTLTTPSDLFSVNCSGNSWLGSSLTEGEHVITVYGTDDSGNSGLIGVHRWIVGIYKFAFVLHFVTMIQNFN